MDFGTVLIVIAVIAVLVAIGSYWGTGRIYSGLGREGGLDMIEERPATTATGAEAQEEIRQMLEAKSERRTARGEEPLDVDAELATLLEPSAETDPALREEIRQLVVARNERRLRQGKEPLDVEAEIERQLRSIGGDSPPPRV